MLQYRRGRVLGMKKWLLVICACVLLAACSNSETQSTEDLQKTIEEGTVGYEIVDGQVEPATNVPEEQRQQILQALDEYISSFNDKDLARFKQTVSQQDATYYAETMKEAEAVFTQYSTIERNTEDVTISKYKEGRAEVFLHVTGRVIEAATETELAASARQIIVLVKEDDVWKVSSVHSINI